MAVNLESLASEAFYNFGFMALDAGERALLGPLQGLGGLVTGFAKNKALEFADCFLKGSSSSQNQPKGDLTNTAKEAGFFALQSLYYMSTGALTSFGTQFLFRNKAFATLAGRAFKNYAPLLVSQIGSLLTTPIWQLGLQVATGQPLHFPSGEQLAMSTFSHASGLALRLASRPKPQIIPTFTQVFNNAIPNNSEKKSRPKGNHDVKDFYSWLENVHLGGHFNNPKYVGNTYSFSYKETRDCVSELKVHKGDVVPEGITGICFRVEEKGKIRITNVVGKESEKAAIALGKNSNHGWEPNENWERACLLTMEDTMLEGWGSQKAKGGRTALPPGTVYKGLASKEIIDRIANLPILRHQAETDPPKPLKAQIYFGRLDRKKSDDKEAPAPFGRFAVRKPGPISGEEIGINLEITSTGQVAELIPIGVHHGEYITDWDTKRALSLNEAFAWKRLAQTHPDFHRKLACAALDDIYLDSLLSSKMGWGPVAIETLQKIIGDGKKVQALNTRGIFYYYPDPSITVTLYGSFYNNSHHLEGFSTRKVIDPRHRSVAISLSFSKNGNLWELVPRLIS